MLHNVTSSRGSVGPLVALSGVLLLLLLAACQPLMPAGTLPAATGSLEAGRPVPDELAVALMRDLASGSDRAASAAVATILTAGDERFVPVFIELLRFDQIGIARFDTGYLDALERLSGQTFGQNWPAWIEWSGRPR